MSDPVILPKYTPAEVNAEDARALTIADLAMHFIDDLDWSDVTVQEAIQHIEQEAMNHLLTPFDTRQLISLVPLNKMCKVVTWH